MDSKHGDLKYVDDESTNEYVWKKKRALDLKRERDDTFSLRLRERILQKINNNNNQNRDAGENIKCKMLIENDHESPRNDMELSNRFLFNHDSEDYSDSLSLRAPLAEKISFSENFSLNETFTIDDDQNRIYTLNDCDGTLTSNSSISDYEELANTSELVEIDELKYDSVFAENERNIKTLIKTNQQIVQLISDPIVPYEIEYHNCQIIINSSEEGTIFYNFQFCPLELEFYFQNFLIATKSDLFFLLSDFSRFITFLITNTKANAPYILHDFSEMKFYSSHHSLSTQLSLSLFLDKILTVLIDSKSSASVQNKLERGILRDEKINFIKCINRYAVEDRLKSLELFELVINTISKTLKHEEKKKVVSDVEHLEQREWTSGCMEAILSDAHMAESFLRAPASEKQHTCMLHFQSSCDFACKKFNFGSCFPFDHIKSNLFQFNGNLDEFKSISKCDTVEKEKKIHEENKRDTCAINAEHQQTCIESSLNFPDGHITRLVHRENEVKNENKCVKCGSVSFTRENDKLQSDVLSIHDSAPLRIDKQFLEQEQSCCLNNIPTVINEEQDVINKISDDKNLNSLIEIQDLIEKGNTLIKKFNFNYLEILQTDNALREGVDDLNLKVLHSSEIIDPNNLTDEDTEIIKDHVKTEVWKQELFEAKVEDHFVSEDNNIMKQKKSESEETKTMSTPQDMCNGIAPPTAVKSILKTNIKRQHSTGSIKKSKKKNHVQFNEGLNKFFDADYVILIRDDDEYDGNLIGCDCEDDYCFEDCYEDYEDYNASKSSHQSRQQKQKYDLCAAFEPPMEFVDQVTLSPPDGYKDCNPHHCFNPDDREQNHTHQQKHQDKGQHQAEQQYQGKFNFHYTLPCLG